MLVISDCLKCSALHGYAIRDEGIGLSGSNGKCDFQNSPF